jgi:hypothetical protein
MAIIDYPDGLPLPQISDKNMTPDTGFLTQIPTRGIPVFQKLTDDLKYRWSVTWILESGGVFSEEARFNRRSWIATASCAF